MKDAASRIAEKYTIGGDWGALKRDHMKRDINRAIRRAVKAEQERCVGIVFSAFDGLHGDFKAMESQIIDAIQAKRPSRKRK